MLKKMFIVSLVAITAGYWAFGRETWSYFRTFGKMVHNEVKKEIPVEFELERGRESVEKLMPEIHQSMKMIAEQQVDVEHLVKQVAAREETLTRMKTHILALREKQGFTEDEAYVSELSDTGNPKQSKELEQRFSRYKILDETHKHEQKLLKSKQEMLEANRTKLVAMMSEKRELELQLAQLETRLKTIQAAETVSSISLDQSELGRARKMITDLNKQLDVREKVLAHEEAYQDLMNLESEMTTKKTENIESEIDQYFKSGVVSSQDKNAKTVVDSK